MCAVYWLKRLLGAHTIDKIAALHSCFTIDCISHQTQLHGLQHIISFNGVEWANII